MQDFFTVRIPVVFRMPIYLLLGLLATPATSATSAGTREDYVVLVTDGGNSEGLDMSHVKVLGGSCPVTDLPLPLEGLTVDVLVLTCGGLYNLWEYNLSCFVLAMTPTPLHS